VRALAVIPARFGSTRFPGKALAPLGGRPVIAHVIANARRAARVGRLVVATDDERIGAAAESAGAAWRMTPSDLPSGSDRAAQVSREIAGEGWQHEIVVNIQGDEPFLPAEAIDRCIGHLEERRDADVATLATPASEAEFLAPDVVKIVLDLGGCAVYFSRAGIPFPRRRAEFAPLKHIGLYAFRRAYLERFVKLRRSPLERAEELEQLRAIDDGARIAVAVGSWEVQGIDTPEDLIRAEERLRRTGAGLPEEARKENA